jgi:hypothetical protein
MPALFSGEWIMRGKCRLVPLLLVIFTAEVWGAVGWNSGYEVGVLQDDNIGGAQPAQDILKDTAVLARAYASYDWSVSEESVLRASGSFDSEQFQDFDGLSSNRAGITLDYRFRPSAGFSAPIYSLFVNMAESNFDSDIRDGSTMELGLRATSHLTDLIALTGGVVNSQRSADSEVFDLERTRYFAHLDYRVGRHSSVYFAADFIDGDVVSTATSTQWLRNWADAIEWDDALSESSRSGGYGQQNTAAIRRYAYRLDADTTVLRLGFNVGLGRRNALDISMEDLESDAVGPSKYKRQTLALSYLHRF